MYYSNHCHAIHIEESTPILCILCKKSRIVELSSAGSTSLAQFSTNLLMFSLFYPFCSSWKGVTTVVYIITVLQIVTYCYYATLVIIMLMMLLTLLSCYHCFRFSLLVWVLPLVLLYSDCILFFAILYYVEGGETATPRR